MKKMNIIKSLAHKKWRREPTNPTQNSPNDHLINTKIRKRHLWISVTHNTKNSRPYRTKNILHEAEISTLAEIREQDTNKQK
jgi:hypothetical protein